MWGRDHHSEATSMQRDHEHSAGRDRGFLASENHGRPTIAATSRPGEFHRPRVMPARAGGSPYGRPETRPIPRPENPARSNDRPMQREKMRGGRAPQPDYNSRREVPPRPGSYRPENAGPRDNGRGHENVAPHGNGGPHENAPQQERGGHSDRGHEERPRQQKSENNPWAGEEPAQMLFRNGFRKPVAECHEPFSKPGVRADCGSMSVMAMLQQQ